MKKVLRLLKPHRVALIFSIIFASVNTVMQLLLPSYTKNIQESIVKGDLPGIWRFGAYMLGFTLIGIVTSIANTYFSTKTSVGYSVTLRNFTFHAQKPDYRPAVVCDDVAGLKLENVVYDEAAAPVGKEQVVLYKSSYAE